MSMGLTMPISKIFLALTQLPTKLIIWLLNELIGTQLELSMVKTSLKR